MKKFWALLLCLIMTPLFAGCNLNNLEESKMGFSFETMDSLDYRGGMHYIMDFGTMITQADAAIVEGKLLAAFGDPVAISKNYEDSFNYVIRVTAEDGRSVMLNVYGMGIVHIGAHQEDEFTLQAANALITYVNSLKPMDYQRTVYYLDVPVRIDISVKNGRATILNFPVSEEEEGELLREFYG